MSTSFPPNALAVVIGSSGAIGGALVERLESDPRFSEVVGLARSSDPSLDVLDEAGIAAAAQAVAARDGELRLVIDATGFLHGDGMQPEKTWRHLDPSVLARVFAVNTIGPALLVKHFLPLFPRDGRAVFATLSARAASMAENTIGGWYGYRASKAALNQIVRTASAELRRTRKQAVCVALHPGHVESRLSAPFGSGGQPTLAPAEAASALLEVLDGLAPEHTGGFFDQEGASIPW